MAEYENGLTHEEIRGFAEHVISIICSEWRGGSYLESSRIRELLDEEGVEVPDYAMSDVLDSLKSRLISLQFRRPDEEARRKHGDCRIGGVAPLLCEEQ